MFTIKSEAHERVMEAIEDIKAGCEVMDDFHEWEDIASSSISIVLEDLDDEQYDNTCSAFLEFIRKTVDENRNLAYGVRAALIRAMKEGMGYLDYVSDDNGEDSLILIMKDTINKAEGLFTD